MGWSEWMSVKQTLSEELVLEKQIRAIRQMQDIEALQELCVVLHRSGWHQRKLLSQAVGRIGELDAIAAANS